MSLKELQIIAVNKCVKPVFHNLGCLDLITHEKLFKFLDWHKGSRFKEMCCNKLRHCISSNSKSNDEKKRYSQMTKKQHLKTIFKNFSA